MKPACLPIPPRPRDCYVLRIPDSSYNGIGRSSTPKITRRIHNRIHSNTFTFPLFRFVESLPDDPGDMLSMCGPSLEPLVAPALDEAAVFNRDAHVVVENDDQPIVVVRHVPL